MAEQVPCMSLNAVSCMLPLSWPCLLITLVTPDSRSAALSAVSEHPLADTVGA